MSVDVVVAAVECTPHPPQARLLHVGAGDKLHAVDALGVRGGAISPVCVNCRSLACSKEIIVIRSLAVSWSSRRIRRRAKFAIA